MNRIVLVVVGIVLILGVIFYMNKRGGEPSPGTAPETVGDGATPPSETHPAKEGGTSGGTPGGASDAEGPGDEAVGEVAKQVAPGPDGKLGTADDIVVSGRRVAPGPDGKTGTADDVVVSGGRFAPGPDGKLGTADDVVVSGRRVAPGTDGKMGTKDDVMVSGGEVAPGPDAKIGTADDVVSGGQVVVPGPDGKIGTADDVQVPGPGPKDPDVADGVDGNVRVGQPLPGDDGDLPPPAAKPTPPPTLAGVAGPRVWLVASDLKKVPGAKGGAFEVGNPDGKKGTEWKNRFGKGGNGVRAKGGTTATFVRGLQTTLGPVDAVALCAPGARGCLNSAPSQIKLGVDLNHPDHWIAGADAAAKSPKGGGSFTALFVAARGSQAANPIMENQNGEAGARQGPFLGWVGKDLVGSIHGLQGIVGMNAVALPATWNEAVTPHVYTLRFDRKKGDLRLFMLTDKGSAAQSQAIEKGDGPDNDQYAAIALGSKNPGRDSVTYVLEAATYARALSDKEICAIHKEWNKKYALKVPAGDVKPCGGK